VRGGGGSTSMNNMAGPAILDSDLTQQTHNSSHILSDGLYGVLGLESEDRLLQFEKRATYPCTHLKQLGSIEKHATYTSITCST